MRAAPSPADLERELLQDVRDFLLVGADLNAEGDPASLLARYLPDAPIVWTVWNGMEVTGGPQDFLNILNDLTPIDPPPDPNPVIDNLAIIPGEPLRAIGDMTVTGRDGQRSRLSYQLIQEGGVWRISEMRGRFLDDGHMALRHV